MDDQITSFQTIDLVIRGLQASAAVFTGVMALMGYRLAAHRWSKDLTDAQKEAREKVVEKYKEQIAFFIAHKEHASLIHWMLKREDEGEDMVAVKSWIRIAAVARLGKSLGRATADGFDKAYREKLKAKEEKAPPPPAT